MRIFHYHAHSLPVKHIGLAATQSVPFQMKQFSISLYSMLADYRSGLEETLSQ